MPPSPRLSACMRTPTYFTVTTSISDQTMSDTQPSTLAGTRRHAMRAGQALLQRVERARGDVAEDDAHGADDGAQAGSRDVALLR